MKLISQIKTFLRYRIFQYYRPIIVNYKKQRLHIDKDIQGTHIIATTGGLFILQQNNLHKILPGQFYGVTKKENTIYVYENLVSSGRVLELKLNNDLQFERRGRILLNNLSPGCHQIDIIDKKLIITDTYHNRILSYDCSSEHIEEFYPLGKLDNGRSSSNYGHMNSIFKNDHEIFILCHNESTKTHKSSDILVTDTHFKFLRTIKTDSKNAHNVVEYQGKILHCDSMDSSLKADKKVVFKCANFTRGLSISDDYIILGGSDYSNTTERQKAKGHVYILNHAYETYTSFNMNNMVTEIRRLDKQDLSFSNNLHQSK